jgi:tetratricopeptide (TPR) repeat protein
MAKSLGILFLVPLLIASAIAAPSDESVRAREHFRKGRVHYELKEYTDALGHFKDAYRLIQAPELLFNIAQCHWKLGQPAEALDFYRNYLRRLPKAQNRAEVERRIEELQKELETVKAARPPPKPEPAPAQAPPPSPTPVAPPPSAAARPTPAAPEPAVQRPASVAATPLDVDAAPPVYKRWWFWTAVVVGVVAVGAAASSGGTEKGTCPFMPCIEIGR